MKSPHSASSFWAWGPKFALGGSQVPTVPVVDPGPVGGVGGGGRQKLLAGAIAGVDQVPVRQGLEGRLVKGRPMALAIICLPLPPAQVPVQAQPGQVVGQLVQVGGLAAVGVQVLHAQDHLAPQAADVQPGQQGGKEVPQVHPAAGAGGEAPPDGPCSFHGLPSSRFLRYFTTVPPSPQRMLAICPGLWYDTDNKSARNEGSPCIHPKAST